jgi:hypothetical protein
LQHKRIALEGLGTAALVSEEAAQLSQSVRVSKCFKDDERAQNRQRKVSNRFRSIKVTAIKSNEEVDDEQSERTSTVILMRSKSAT